MRRSTASFMNAFTYADRTVYPFASTDRNDFFNLLDVYLDRRYDVLNQIDSGDVKLRDAVCPIGEAKLVEGVSVDASLDALSGQVGREGAAEEDIVVGAAKREQSLGNVASAVTVVSGDRIRRFGYRTVGEAVGAVAGVYLEDNRINASLGIRGLQIPGDFNTRSAVSASIAASASPSVRVPGGCRTPHRSCTCSACRCRGCRRRRRRAAPRRSSTGCPTRAA